MKHKSNFTFNLKEETDKYFSLLKEEDFNFKNKDILVDFNKDKKDLKIQVNSNSIKEMKIAVFSLMNTLDVIDKTLNI